MISDESCFAIGRTVSNTVRSQLVELDLTTDELRKLEAIVIEDVMSEFARRRIDVRLKGKK